MVVVIEETLCCVAMRKDCSSKKTCQLRHLNEEAGRDLEYYTRKFERTSQVIDKDNNCSISLSYPVSDFEKEQVKGDGHFIVHSVLSLLQEKGKSVPKLKDLLTKIKEVFQENLEEYAPFVDGWETDPIEEMDNYVNNARYDSDIVDLIVPLIAKCLDLGIIVVTLDPSVNMYTTNANVMYPCPELITDDPLFLLKSGNHYDPLHKVSSSHSLSPNVSKDSESQESAPACVDSTLFTVSTMKGSASSMRLTTALVISSFSNSNAWHASGGNGNVCALISGLTFKE